MPRMPDPGHPRWRWMVLGGALLALACAGSGDDSTSDEDGGSGGSPTGGTTNAGAPVNGAGGAPEATTGGAAPSTSGGDGTGGDAAGLGGTGGPPPGAGGGGTVGGAIGTAGAPATGAAAAEGGSVGAQGAGGAPGTAGSSGLAGSPGYGGAATAGSGAGGSSGVGPSGGAAGAGGGAGPAGGGAGPIDDVLPSPGCDASVVAADGRFTIDVGGTAREYILALPPDYPAGGPHPLIFAWHGGQYSADWVAAGDPPQSGPYYGVQEAAAGAAVFVAPQALSGSWTNQDGRDIAFVDAMLDRFADEICFDRSRVFSVGFSMGGIMTMTIGCERGDVFRAVAPMSGRLTGGCPDSTDPIAYWSSHGTSDPTIPIANGEAARDEFVRINHCDAETAATEPTGCVRYLGCDDGAPVVWCPFDGVHEPAPFAGSAIWEFFAAL